MANETDIVGSKFKGDVSRGREQDQGASSSTAGVPLTPIKNVGQANIKAEEWAGQTRPVSSEQADATAHGMKPTNSALPGKSEASRPSSIPEKPGAFNR